MDLPYDMTMNSFLELFLGAENVKHWLKLKAQLQYSSNSDFAAWLLRTAEYCYKKHKSVSASEPTAPHHHPQQQGAGGSSAIATSRGNLWSPPPQQQQHHQQQPASRASSHYSQQAAAASTPQPIQHSIDDDGPARFHVCRACGCVFQQKASLKRHMAEEHPKERRHNCPECPAQFTRKDHMFRHLRKHQGIFPFNCDSCGKSFTRKDSWIKHEKWHQCNPFGSSPTMVPGRSGRGSSSEGSGGGEMTRNYHTTSIVVDHGDGK